MPDKLVKETNQKFAAFSKCQIANGMLRDALKVVNAEERYSMVPPKVLEMRVREALYYYVNEIEGGVEAILERFMIPKEEFEELSKALYNAVCKKSPKLKSDSDDLMRDIRRFLAYKMGVSSKFQEFIANHIAEKKMTAGPLLDDSANDEALLDMMAGMFEGRREGLKRTGFQQKEMRELGSKAFQNYIRSHLAGIDFREPVELKVLKPGVTLAQFVYPTRDVGKIRLGQYFTYAKDPVQPDTLGINPYGWNRASMRPEHRLRVEYNCDKPILVLTSRAAAIIDSWSVGKKSVGDDFYQEHYVTPGGGLQILIAHCHHDRLSMCAGMDAKLDEQLALLEASPSALHAAALSDAMDPFAKILEDLAVSQRMLAEDIRALQTSSASPKERAVKVHAKGGHLDNRFFTYNDGNIVGKS